MNDGPKLTLLRGGRASSARIEQLQIIAEVSQKPSFEADFEVFEEDLFLVLSAPCVIPDVQQHPVRVMTEVLDAKPRALGEIVRSGRRLLAVVHDLSRDPTTTEQSVSEALFAALRLADREKASALRLPLLGSLHGPISEKRSIDLILQAISGLALPNLKRLGIAGREASLPAIEAALSRLE